MKKSLHIKTFKDSQEQYWKEFRDKFLEDFIEDFASDYENQEQESQKDIRSRANTTFANFVSKKLGSFIKECKAKKEIWIRDEYPFNKGWIVDDEKMNNTLKRYPNFFKILNFIDKEVKHIDNIGIESWTTYTAKTKSGTEVRKYSHVIVNKDFYARAEKKIEVGQKAMQECLQEFCKMGSLKQIGHLKSYNRAMLYIDGYFRPVGKIGKMKKDYYMNQKDHQKALRKFEY